MSETRELLRIEDLRAGYGEAVVLHDISLTLNEGETLALLGRNGTGKTTLMDTLVGVTTQHGGQMHLGGVPLHGMASHERAALGIGWVPQERNIFKSLTVHENLTAVARPGRAGHAARAAHATAAGVGLVADAAALMERRERAVAAPLAAIVFLLSPAAAYITGSCIRIDGGGPNARPMWHKLAPSDRSKPFEGFHRARLPAILDGGNKE